MDAVHDSLQHKVPHLTGRVLLVHLEERFQMLDFHRTKPVCRLQVVHNVILERFNAIREGM